jgi:hypothetical protein
LKRNPIPILIGNGFTDAAFQQWPETRLDLKAYG